MTNPQTGNDTSSILENKGKEDVMDIVAGLFLALLAVTTLIWIIPSHTETTSSGHHSPAIGKALQPIPIIEFFNHSWTML